MLKPFSLFYCIVLFFQATCATDYCTICKNNSHTMCKYKRGPAESCVKYTSVNMTSEIQNTIVNLHNELRDKVASGNETRGKFGPQPSAANMLSIGWDDELATIAQRWADQCVPTTAENQHDQCKDMERFKVGQNVIQAIRGSKPLAFEKMIKAMIFNWYNEVDRVNPQEISKFKGADEVAKEFGHYAQLVWATTKYVGCGHASFAENISHGKRTTEATIDTFICNYGPTGNVIDASIYKIGKPCSECTCNEAFSALCSDTEGTLSTENTTCQKPYTMTVTISEITHRERQGNQFQEQEDSIYFHLQPQALRQENSEMFHMEPQALIYIDDKEETSMSATFINFHEVSKNLETVNNEKLELGKQNFRTHKSSDRSNERSYLRLPQKLFELLEIVKQLNLGSNNQLMQDLNALYDKHLKNTSTTTLETGYRKYDDEIKFRDLKVTKATIKQKSTTAGRERSTVKAKDQKTVTTKSTTKKHARMEEDMGKNTPASAVASKQPLSKSTKTSEATVAPNRQTTAATYSTACTTQTEHHNYHKRGKRPFESYEFQYRYLQYLHREGDDCYCLYRIRGSASKVPEKTYLLCLFYIILYLFYC